MNAQTFHMFLQELVDAWKGPAKRAVAAMRTLSLEVATQLARTVAANYPKVKRGPFTKSPLDCASRF